MSIWLAEINALYAGHGCTWRDRLRCFRAASCLIETPLSRTLLVGSAHSPMPYNCLKALWEFVVLSRLAVMV